MQIELKSVGIKARAVFLDKGYVFIDGRRKAKWIIILSDNVTDDGIVFTLTTSQVATYTDSFRDYILVKKEDEPCFEKDCVIEIERTDFIESSILLNKYKSQCLEYKGDISQELFERILDKIAECYSIQEHIKKGLGV